MRAKVASSRFVGVGTSRYLPTSCGIEMAGLRIADFAGMSDGASAIDWIPRSHVARSIDNGVDGWLLAQRHRIASRPAFRPGRANDIDRFVLIRRAEINLNGVVRVTGRTCVGRQLGV